MNIKNIQPLIGLAFLGIVHQAYAGGLYLYEIGTEDLGLASAGTAARAQDASTVATNPAGMTRLNGKQLVVGVQALYGDVNYSMDNPNLTGPGNIVGWLPGLNTFYSQSISDDLKIGVAVYGNFGLSLGFDEDWAGRFLVKDSTLLGVTVQPAFAYRINDSWSLGLGIGLNLGVFSLTRDSLAGNEKTLDDTDVAYNGRLGVLFTPTKQTRFGLTYAGKVDYQFDVDASGNLPAGGGRWDLPISTAVGAPQQVMFSAVQSLGEKWSVLGNIGWQDWSSFSDLAVSAAGVEIASSLDLQDTWHFALGTQYQMQSATRLNFGIAYDTSMYNDQNNTSLTMPSGVSWRFGTGVLQQLNEKASLGVAIEYLTSEDSRVSSPASLAGSYNDPQMYFLSVHYTYRF